MNRHDLLYALLLPVPPWLGFLIYRLRGQVGVGYGYFLGGILAVLAMPWPLLGQGMPSPHLGGALLGFTIFIVAHREGGQGLRHLAYGVGGATVFVWITGARLGLDMRSVAAFWTMALLDGGLWLVLSDLGYRFTQGRWLSMRMPATGGLAFLGATDLFRNLPLGAATLDWASSLLAGILLGLVALQQLLWLRRQGVWVEGRGDGFRVALSALEGAKPPEDRTLTYAMEARQAMFLVNEKGMLLETNTAFSRMVGFPRHQVRGYQLQDLFQGREAPAWEALREKLLRDFRGSVPATLVRKDSSFLAVRLEAVAFDRNLALVWIADPAPGTLALRGDADPAAQAPVLGAGPLAEPALAAILPAVEEILEEAWNPRAREAAERILAEARRLRPDDPPRAPRLQADAALEAMLPRLRRMLPAGVAAAVRSAPLTLSLETEALERIATQVLLHGRQGLAEGEACLVLAPAELGGRLWARLELELSGRPAPAQEGFVGFTWLQDAARAAQGFLELRRDDLGRLWPRVYLPCRQPAAESARSWLQGRRIAIVDRDPQVRGALAGWVQGAGGEPAAFDGLRAFLAAARRQPRPDAVVLDAGALPARHQARLRRLAGPEPPALLVLGDPSPHLPPGPGRILHLDKPFPGQLAIQALLALLQNEPAATGRPQPEMTESPCPQSP